MDSIMCPYCECRVNVCDVDDEGGVCPECGSVITGSHLMRQAIGADFDDEDEEDTVDKDLVDDQDDFDEDFDDDDDDESTDY